MKQKTKLSYRLQKKDIQGTHLAMSPNGKHVALKMADSLVIALPFFCKLTSMVPIGPLTGM